MIGDAADDLLDSLFGHWEDYGDEEDDRTGRVKCRRCGVRNIEWVDIGGRWRLYDGRLPHKCDTARIADQDFEVGS